MYAAIAVLARHLHSSQGSHAVEDVLPEVTAGAVRLLPGVDHAGISLVVKGHSREIASTAATGSVPMKLDELQQKYQQGPCWDAIWEHHTVRVDDFESEARWPEFVEAACAETPVRSSLSIQLYTDETELGALNLYCERPHIFDAHIEEIALALAAHAAIAFSGARRSDQFRSALASRDIIGQAKGIVMERYKVNAVAAFGLLLRLSQNTNTPLYEIARRLINADYPPDQGDGTCN
ncbi:GAF and ANTAR domain-containing protein [Mycobacterium timonense]|uniref:GAF and ANTAR domain-containing protein n=1 Tax=Mycobacterium timonense TaxID=701043 RepID=UPI001FCB0E9E|nr:GAF and ANTAR domain-containing protein [Mycobacterium timonense]